MDLWLISVALTILLLGGALRTYVCIVLYTYEAKY